MLRLRISIVFALGMLLPGLVLGGTFSLGTEGASGALSVANLNNEAVEPNTAGGKAFDYPYYFDSVQNLWVVVVAEQLSASTTYRQETHYAVQNKGVTDADFGTFSFGSLEWNSGAVSGMGVEQLGLGEFSLELDLSPFSPLNSPRNVNNEFAWDYVATVSNYQGSGLTLTDGEVSSVDFSADIEIVIRPFGNNSLALAEAYGGTVAFSGDTFAFDVDVTQNNLSAFGELTDTRLVFDAAGTLIGVVPEPSTMLLCVGGGLLLFWVRRRRSA